jgi:hypothetical protein
VVCRYLSIPTGPSYFWDYVLGKGKTERLVDLYRQSGATEYASEPAAAGYIGTAQFASSSIALTWFDYATIRKIRSSGERLNTVL